jgi:hypothetical protein
MLHRASQLAVLLLIMSIIAAPVMACMVPGRQMSAEERNCCKRMPHDCETSATPTSHSCCQHPVSRHVASVSIPRTVDVGYSAAALLQADFTPAVQTNPRIVHGSESPPESPLKKNNVLRI